MQSCRRVTLTYGTSARVSRRLFLPSWRHETTCPTIERQLHEADFDNNRAPNENARYVGRFHSELQLSWMAHGLIFDGKSYDYGVIIEYDTGTAVIEYDSKYISREKETR